MSETVDHTVVRAGEEKAFFAASVTWEHNERERAIKSERRAWLVAGCACVMALVAVIGLALLAPMKQTVPYIFAVDKATGNMELMSVGDARTVRDQQTLLDKHWAHKYVIARESYYWKLLQHDYDTVLMMSNDPVGRDYAKLFEGPHARDKKLGSDKELQVQVLSITLSQDEFGSKATVRFEKVLKRLDVAVVEVPLTYVATFSYEYTPSMTGKEKELVQNPLGFKVTSWRLDPEMSTGTVTTAVMTSGDPSLENQTTDSLRKGGVAP